MCAHRMHADEIDVDVDLVRRLVAAQFPEWARLELAPVASDGSENALFRLGGDRVVRLPRTAAAAGQVEKEHRWLPRVGPSLPLAVPIPLARGAPGDGYPLHWSVYGWLAGRPALGERLTDPQAAAQALAAFLVALRRIDTAGGPPPGGHNFFRGVPLAFRDDPTRHAIASLDGVLDTEAVIAAWEADRRAAPWGGPGRWIHGDLTAANLLVDEGRLTAVIDFGGLAVGDPACDLIVAWSLLSAEARAAFRAAADVNDATWKRGRAWALSVAVIALPYYMDTNPVIVANAMRMIAEVLAEPGRGA